MNDLYVVFKSLLMPPGILVSGLLLAVLLVPGGVGRAVLLAATLAFTAMTLPAIGAWMMAPLEQHAPLATAAHPIPADAEAILVLSAGRASAAPEYGGESVDNATLRRLRYGARLQRATGLPLYVSGGSPPPETPPVAQLMAEVLRDEYGIRVAGVEAQSLNTWENATYSAAMLARAGHTRILLVSDAWHLRRALAVFKEVGLTPIAASTGFLHDPDPKDWSYRDWLPSAHGFVVSYYALHEHIGWLWYRLRRLVVGAPRPVSN
ncbi:YdcF family protein [Marichromatium bheemlicum]|uniref:YdcF family protein n=1 Tax=Marichromatium bheemlicum TaxID=365339 RepID=A0ABX1I651_9GAMM|nr:YdcF family protein [Marichromatium bheemlicum]NKN33039.1 YdcF family protein [Marichromatium bheemlicum]